MTMHETSCNRWLAGLVMLILGLAAAGCGGRTGSVASAEEVAARVMAANPDAEPEFVAEDWDVPWDQMDRWGRSAPGVAQLPAAPPMERQTTELRLEANPAATVDWSNPPPAGADSAGESSRTVDHTPGDGLITARGSVPGIGALSGGPPRTRSPRVSPDITTLRPGAVSTAEPGEPFWTIILGTYAGAAHQQTAAAMRQRMVQTSPEVAASRIHTTEKGSMIILGRFADVDDPTAQAELKRLQSLQVNRTRPFAFAMMSRIVPETPTAALDPLDLRRARRENPMIDPLYTLQIAVWVSEEGVFSAEEARKQAEAFARSLRGQNLDSFFYHDPIKGTSHVSIGIFDESAYDPKSTLFSAPVERLLKRFPNMLLNGEEALVQTDKGAPSQRVPLASMLVNVPK
jgi:hypothetical protein